MTSYALVSMFGLRCLYVRFGLLVSFGLWYVVLDVWWLCSCSLGFVAYFSNFVFFCVNGCIFTYVILH